MIQTANKTKRCAVYTRKSQEEGLDQAFNSLDAQREAGLDYIKSQKHEGWQAVTKQYDDGGFSGGNIERPAMQKLMEDIKHHRIDIVIVYKVDRLSRSLADFAQLMKLFDEYKISFVSVTQQFNTTTSMGRLTLNMLLTFAQFEREVTSERIRDKITATKKKGYWVNGQPPLGYKSVDMKLQVIPEQAKLVKRIFNEYLNDQSLLNVAALLNHEGHTTKKWTSPSSGKTHGGKPFSSKPVHTILTNPIYIGKITHKENIYPGIHEPIIDKNIWDDVQAKIKSRKKKQTHRWEHPFLLKGKLRLNDEYAISPGSVQSTNRITGTKSLTKYYVSQKAIRLGYKACQIKSINATHLDELVRTLIFNYLCNRSEFNSLYTKPIQDQNGWIRKFTKVIYLTPHRISIHLSAIKIQDYQDEQNKNFYQEKEPAQVKLPTCHYQPHIESLKDRITLTLNIQIKKHDHKRILLSPEGQDLYLPAHPKPKEHILKIIAQAHSWRKQLKANPKLQIKEIAQQDNASESQIHKNLQLINLSPEILKGILTGTLPNRITHLNLLNAAKHLDWQAQRDYLNLPI